jgi:hypothetical protein
MDDPANGDKPDPTSNVLSLVKAAVERLDDLRDTTNKRLDAEIGHVKELSDLRAAHAAEIRALEAERLEKTRDIDVLARTVESNRTSEAITALAATTASNAENIRNTVTTTADALAKQTNNTVVAITDRIAALEKSRYEEQGRSMVADPQLAELILQVRALLTNQSKATGKLEGFSSGWAVLLGVVGLVTSLLAITAYLMK